MLKFCKENVCLLVFEQARSQGSSHVFIFNSSPQYYDSAKLRQSEGYISVSLGNYYSLSFIYKIIILYCSLILCTLFRLLLFQLGKCTLFHHCTFTRHEAWEYLATKTSKREEWGV